MCNASAYVCKLFVFIFCLFSVKGKEALSNLGDTHVLLLRELENTNSWFHSWTAYENDNKREAVNFELRRPGYAVNYSTVLGSSSGCQMLPMMKFA